MRWNNLTDEDLDARVIYVGTYGHPDSDAAGGVWAHTPKGFDAMMRRALNEEGRMYASEYESARSVADACWYVGPFAQTVAETLADMEEPARAVELRDDIRMSASGYIY